VYLPPKISKNIVRMPGEGLDESGTLISPLEDMLGHNYKNEEDG